MTQKDVVIYSKQPLSMLLSFTEKHCTQRLNVMDDENVHFTSSEQKENQLYEKYKHDKKFAKMMNESIKKEDYKVALEVGSSEQSIVEDIIDFYLPIFLSESLEKIDEFVFVIRESLTLFDSDMKRRILR